MLAALSGNEPVSSLLRSNLFQFALPYETELQRFRLRPARRDRSSASTKSLNEIWKALQKVRNSMISIRLSPRSHLLTNDCVSPIRRASSFWFKPACFRIARRASRKISYWAE
jgi:hypothetical protein